MKSLISAFYMKVYLCLYFDSLANEYDNFAFVVGVSTPALLPLNLDNGLPSRVRACLRQQTEHAPEFKGKAFRSCKYLSILYSRVQGRKKYDDLHS